MLMVPAPAAGDTRGSYLKSLRIAAGRSTRDVETAAKVGQGTVTHVEAGKRTNIGDAVYSAIATALGTDPATVLALPVQAAVAPPEQGEVLAFVPHALIDRSDINPRRSFDDGALSTLADSIAEHGIVQPIMLRPRDDVPGRYWIVVGERRWRAMGLLVENGRVDGDAAAMPARVRRMNDREHREIALVENMHRNDVAPLEEAEGIAQLVKDYGGDTSAAAAAIGKTGKSGQRYVQIALNLVEKLIPEVQAALRDGTINKEMARQLTVANRERQLSLLQDIRYGYVRNGRDLRERMQHRNFHANNALFGRLEYNGPVVEDPDSDGVIFTDLEQVRRLQIEAMEKRAANHRDAYPHHAVKVILDDSNWNPDSFRANQDGFYRRNKVERMPPTAQPALVLVLKSNMSVSAFDDLVKLPPAPTTAAGKKQAAKAAGDVLADFPSGAKMHARRCRTEALQRALFKEAGWRTLLAHLCLNLLEGNLDHTPMLAVRAEHRSPDVRAVDPDIADVINDFRENLEFMKGERLFVEPDQKDPFMRVLSEDSGGKKRTGAEVLAALYDLEDADLLELAMALLASRAGTWYGNGVNAEPDIGDRIETLAACKQLGLTQAVADDAGAIFWPAYLEKLNGPHLDTVRHHVDMPAAYNGLAGARWSEAAQKEKRAGLAAWLNDRPDKAAFVPAIFRFGDGAAITDAMRAEANATRPAAKAAE